MLSTKRRPWLWHFVASLRPRSGPRRAADRYRPSCEPLEPRTVPSSMGASTAQLRAAYGQIPLSFEPNQGQTDAQVRFLSRGSGYGLFLASTEAVLSLTKPVAADTGTAGAAANAEDAVLRMQLVGANADPQVTGMEELPGKSNYFIGSDPAQWRTNISTYDKVAYHAVYPGIDLVYYGNQRQLEYDFVVAPGADAGAIRLDFQGAESLALDGQGNLVLHTDGGDVIEHAPVLYQESGGGRQTVAGSYVLEGADRVGFTVAGYDHSRPLVIDPVLSYSTYLGGNRDDGGTSIAVDRDGYAYVTGTTTSTNFPTTPGALRTTNPDGDPNAFVTKLSQDGSHLVYSTYLGGAGIYYENTGGFGIAVDTAGNAYITGATRSVNFPTTANVFQPRIGGCWDAFVTKLSPSGSLAYSTYLGGPGGDHGQAIAVDTADNAYVTGWTQPVQPGDCGSSGSNFPTTPGAFQRSNHGDTDAEAFVAKVNPDGSRLIYSTYLGGSDNDYGNGIAVDAGGNAYVTGGTRSTNFPTTSRAFQRASGGNFDAFVTKVNPDGSALVYSTYLGGSASDGSQAIAVDANDFAYVTGGTYSDNFPTTPGAFQTTYAGQANAFVTKLSQDGSYLVYSTYLGGSASTAGNGIAVDTTGNAYVTGITNSPDNRFPVTPGAPQMNPGGGSDAFVTMLNSFGSGLIYSTYLGGSGGDAGAAIAVDAAGNAYITGGTSSTDFPTTPGAFQRTYGGGSGDAFVAKISAATTHLNLSPSANPVIAGMSFDLTVKALNITNQIDPSYRGTIHFTSSDPQATLPPDYTFTPADNGVHTFMMMTTLRTAGSQTILVKDTDRYINDSISGQVPLTVIPAAASTLSVAGFPSSVKAGDRHSLTVTPMDPYGNKATGYRGTVHFTSSDPQAVLPSDYTFTAADNGMHTFPAELRTAGTQSITATDTANPAITGTQSGVVVHGASAATLRVKAQDSSIPRGTPFAITVTARDLFQNRATHYLDTIHFTSTDPLAQLPSDYTFMQADHGRQTFQVMLNTLGDQTIVVRDTVHPEIFGFLTVTVVPRFFDPPIFSSSGRNPDAEAVGDFNHDGIPDLAVANSADNTVSILLGNGDGSFRLAQTLPTGLLPVSVAVGVFTGSRNLDLAVANHDDNTVSIFLGNGDGTFRPFRTYTVGLFPAAVAVGDFNGDGKLDLITANNAEADVTVLLGNGDGTFGPPIASGVGGFPIALAVGDFNGDGKLDVATANPGSDTVSVLLGNGDGSFQLDPQKIYRVGHEPMSVADFNGDGVSDLAVANSGSNDVSVLLGNGDGTFTAAVSYPAGPNPMAVAVADFNGDGLPDLAVTNASSNQVSVLRGIGDGSFQAPLAFDVGTQPVAVAVADFNGDGASDLVTADFGSDDVAVLLNAADWPPDRAAGNSRQEIAIGLGDGPALPLPGSGNRPVLSPAHLSRETPRDVPRWAVACLPDPLPKERRDSSLMIEQVIPAVVPNLLDDAALWGWWRDWD